jgi:hypothetical protein
VRELDARGPAAEHQQTEIDLVRTVVGPLCETRHCHCFLVPGDRALTIGCVKGGSTAKSTILPLRRERLFRPSSRPIHSAKRADLQSEQHLRERGCSRISAC